MKKLLLSALLAWSIVFVPLSRLSVARNPPKLGTPQAQAAPKPAPKEDEKSPPKKKGIFGRATDAVKKVPKVATDVVTGRTTTDPVALALGALFNDQLPIKLDARTAYKEAPTPTNFRPVRLNLTVKNLSAPLPPGDYTIPIHTTCAKASAHAPGSGVGYRLAPLQGKQANAYATLLMRGDIAQVPHRTLQMIAWSIQASVPYSEMPKEHQAIIDKLIPEYKNDISGGFLQRVVDRYQNFASKNSKILPLDTLLEQAGVGDSLRGINRSRNIIREEAFNYQRSQERLFEGPPAERVITPSNPEESPWAEIQPGVFTQMVIKNGLEGVNDLNVRITPQSGETGEDPYRRQVPMFLQAAYGAQRGASKGISAAAILGVGVVELEPPVALATLGAMVVAGVSYLIHVGNAPQNPSSLTGPGQRRTLHSILHPQTLRTQLSTLRR